MKHSVMNIVQQKRDHGCVKSVALGAEAPAQSITLRTGRQASVLTVERGMAWVTLPGSASQAPQDLWLHAGQSLPLAAQQTLWVDGWPRAELSLQAAPHAPLRLWSLVQRLVVRLRRRTATSQLPCSAT